MKILCVFSQYNYGDPLRGESYEYYNFIPTLRRLGHEVFFLESWNRSNYPNFRELNKKLLHTVETIRPDIVFACLFCYEIWIETWQILRDSGITATINWTTDDSWKYNQFSRFVAPAFHAFTTTYPFIYDRYHQDNIQHVILTQWAARSDTLRDPIPAADCRYQVSFVGTAHGNRPALIHLLHQNGIEVTCFGYGWPTGSIPSNAVPEIFRNSVININFANSALSWNGLWPSRINQIKARTFEVTGSGGFLLTEWADGLDSFYIPGREIAVFRSPREMIKQVIYYLNNPSERDAVAQAGYERTCSEHTYDQRLSEVLDFTLAQRDQFYWHNNVQPTRSIDWERFENVAKLHAMNEDLWALKKVLNKLCSTIWGPVRGSRAARRLVFELSWRLNGTNTYSAAGIPGRMFYEVQ